MKENIIYEDSQCRISTDKYNYIVTNLKGKKHTTYFPIACRLDDVLIEVQEYRKFKKASLFIANLMRKEYKITK